MSYVGHSEHRCMRCNQVSTWPADEFPDQCWKINPETGDTCGSTEFKGWRVLLNDGTGLREV